MIPLQLIRSVVDSFVDAAAIIGLDLDVLHVNSAYLRMARMRHRHLAARNVRGMCHEHFGLSSCADNCVSRRALTSGRTCRVDEVESSRFPLRLIVVATPLFDESGAVWGVIEQYRDVTAESRMQENYRKMLEKERAQKEILEAEVSRQTVEIARANDELRRALEQVMRLANTDSLTGLLNRRSYDERFAQQIAGSQRNGSEFALLLFDLDHFKRINDTHGHPTGDKTLADFAVALRAAATEADVVARIGGEEFAMLLPGATVHGAITMAKRVQHEARAVRLLTTTSVGVAVYPADGVGRVELLRAADRALYSAKAAGRNCVLTASEPTVRALSSVSSLPPARRSPPS